ncbi:MAG: hypothetical protein ACJA04_001025 [Cellvibrionaceae bacterium]|jgi:hypothetical protein
MTLTCGTRPNPFAHKIRFPRFFSQYQLAPKQAGLELDLMPQAHSLLTLHYTDERLTDFTQEEIDDPNVRKFLQNIRFIVTTGAKINGLIRKNHFQ